MAKRFIVKDWAGNTCFKGKTFPSFEDSWGYIYQIYNHLPEKKFDQQMEEFYVEEVSQ